MEKNIFEGAKFGDAFTTNTGSCALYIRYENNMHMLVCKHGGVLFCNDNGEPYENRQHVFYTLSIVSKCEK